MGCKKKEKSLLAINLQFTFHLQNPSDRFNHPKLNNYIWKSTLQPYHYCGFQTTSFIKIGPIPSLALMVSSELLISQRPLFFSYELLMRRDAFKAVGENRWETVALKKKKKEKRQPVWAKDLTLKHFNESRISLGFFRDHKGWIVKCRSRWIPDFKPWATSDLIILDCHAVPTVMELNVSTSGRKWHVSF